MGFAHLKLQLAPALLAIVQTYNVSNYCVSCLFPLYLADQVTDKLADVF